jgi:hypothetical protein
MRLGNLSPDFGKGLIAFFQNGELISVSSLHLMEFCNLKSEFDQVFTGCLGIQVDLTDQAVAIYLRNEMFRFLKLMETIDQNLRF